MNKSYRKETGVIILNWNGLELLKRFMPSVVRFTKGNDIEVAVADNGSTDCSTEWLRNNYPEVRILEFSENHGYAGGYNLALKEGGYRYTILLNSDVEVTDGWYQPLVDLLKNNEDIGAVQPKIRSLRSPELFEYAGAAGGLLDKYGYPYCRGRLFESIEKDEGQYDDDVSEVAWASGACLAVATDIFLKLGGLDEAFFAHMEEIDLCCRMIAAGYRICATSRSTVYHLGGGTLPQGDSRKVYLNFRNNLLLLHKNLPLKKGKRILFVRRLADTLAMGMYLMKGHFGDAKAIWDAHRDFRKMRKTYTNLPVEDKLSGLPGADRMIVIDYYLKGIRK